MTASLCRATVRVMVEWTVQGNGRVTGEERSWRAAAHPIPVAVSVTSRQLFLMPRTLATHTHSQFPTHVGNGDSEAAWNVHRLPTKLHEFCGVSGSKGSQLGSG